MKMKLDDIHIGSRLRIEYGDLEGLAESIKKYGLIHPIVVDSNNNLVAGGRRYFAVVRLGESEIETRMIGDLSETELRMLELEENIRRKDLTPAENSRRLIELAELKSAELMKAKEEIDLSTESVDNYEKSKPNHRPTVINSLQNIASEIGVPPVTLRDAKKHVEAVNQYPDLETLPKYQAIETAKERNNVTSIAEVRQAKRTDEDRQDEQDGIEYRKFLDLVYGILEYRADENTMRAVAKEAPELVSELEAIDRAVNKLNDMKSMLKGAKNGKSVRQAGERIYR